MIRISLFILLMIFNCLNTVSYAQERIILLTPKDCLLMARHTPSADVKYNPGEDVRGKKVAPAEIKNNDFINHNDEGYSFYLTHDALVGNEGINPNTANQLGIEGANEGKVILGRVTVKDGDVLWNGNSLKERDRERIYLLCEQNQNDMEKEEKRRPITKR